jgi:hypothetical protein
MVEVMWIPASSEGRSGMRGWLADERFPEIAKYIHRACYLLSQGRPTARIALYHPTMSMWLGDGQANESTLSIMQQLLEHQRDFDVVDDRSLATLLTLEGGELKNLSGQGYAAVVVPCVTVMSRAALDKLKAFAEAGGSVVFLGKMPSIAVDKTFLHADSPADLDWARHEPSGTLTAAVLEALPARDVRLDSPCAALKYVHRSLPDADVYFFFNESTEAQSRKVSLTGSGKPQIWDATSGEIRAVTDAVSEGDAVGVPLRLAPYETTFIVISHGAMAAAAPRP